MDILGHTLDGLAADIDRFGLGAVEAEVTALAEQAREAGISPIALAVLTDRSEPEIARERAFGLVATQLTQAPARHAAAIAA
jgi:hypothetical protein